MAEPISIQQLKDASLDVKSLEEVVNGDENVVVTTRLGETYPSVKGSIKKVFENGGLPAVPKKTYADLSGSGLPEGAYAVVTDDPIVPQNGLYVISGGAWVKSAYDPTTHAIDYINSSGFGVITPLLSANINYVSATSTIVFKDTIRVTANNERHTVAVPINVVVEEPKNELKRLEFNVESKTIRAVSYNALSEQKWIVIAVFYIEDGKLITNDILQYQNDGVDYKSGAGGGSTNQFLLHAPSAITIDTLTNELRLSNPRIIYANGSKVTTTQTLSLPSSDGLYRLEYDSNANSFSLSISTNSLVKSKIVLGKLFRWTTTNGTNYKLFDVDMYNIDGVTEGLETQTFGGYGSGASNTAKAYLNTANSIVINTVSNQIEFSVLRIINGSDSFTTVAGVIPLPQVNGLYRLEYNKQTNLFYTNPSSANLVKDRLIFGRLFRGTTTNGVIYKLFDIDMYRIDGTAYGLDTPDAPVGTSGIVNAKLSAGKPTEIAVDTIAKTITIEANRARLNWGSTSKLLPATVIDYSSAVNNSWYELMYNTATNAFYVKSTGSTPVATSVRVGLLHATTGALDNVPTYSINGIDASPSKSIVDNTDARFTDFVVPYLNVSEDWRPDAELPALKPVYDATLKNLTAFYALWDALVTANPDYITMTVLGLDTTGNEIRQYHFKPPVVGDYAKSSSDNSGNDRIERPKIILAAGVHPEYAGIYNTYNVMKIICEDWETHKSLETLRWGVEFVVVPIANAHSFINTGRKNINGVDIARNFPSGWVFREDTTSVVYGGTAPLTEIEAQLLDGVMNTHKDAIAFISHHSMVGLEPVEGSSTPAGTFFWTACNSYFCHNLGKAQVVQTTMSAKKRYTWIRDNLNGWLGLSDLGAVGGTESMHAMREYGILGVTLETNQWLYLEEGNPVMSAAVTTLGAEALINWFLLNLRHAPEFYNNQLSK